MNLVVIHVVASRKNAVAVLYAVVPPKNAVLVYAANPIKFAWTGSAYARRGLFHAAVHAVTPSLKSAWTGSAETHFARAVLGNAARSWMAVS